MSDRDALLVRYLRSVRHHAYRPGRWDCALFAAGWVKACTGKDPARGWRSKYRSLDAGRAKLAEAGHGTLADLASTHAEHVGGWMSARVGDVAIVHEAGAECFGIVGGDRIHVLAPTRGVHTVSLSRAVEVYRP